MRRGHTGPGGWRNENPRHFGPRAGVNPNNFRSNRPFGHPDGPRFPPGGYRFKGPYPHHSDDRRHLDDRRHPDDGNHDKYRGSAPNRLSSQTRLDRPHHTRDGRQLLPFIQQIRNKDNDHSYKKSSYYEGSKQYSVNKMGDIDHRQSSGPPNRDLYNPRQISPWVNPPFESRHYYNDHKSPHKTPRHHSSNDAMPLQEYSGHRPPASDHYAATPGPNNNNTPYSRSVDDTVDIVRKRLMNRDSQINEEPTDSQEIDEDLRVHSNKEYHVPQGQPVKKKTPKLKPIVKSNCDQMKTKIVHQLFKMDKGKMHKLMDNPSSSSKFEFAISSLITESQNSLNRHLRSQAEKSLCNSSEFINNDSNTIYEDIFMRQMQCIMDPQDAVLLEDIKPLVLQELSKVLQIDLSGIHGSEDYGSNSRDEHLDNLYYNENEQYSEQVYYDQHGAENVSAESAEFLDTDYSQSCSYMQESSTEDVKPLFERRPAKRSEHGQERLKSSENHLDFSQERIKSSESRQSDYSLEWERNTESRQSDSFQEWDKNIQKGQADCSQENVSAKHQSDTQDNSISAESQKSDCSQEMLNSTENQQHDYSEERLKSAENRRKSRQSNDLSIKEESDTNQVPLFDPNVGQLSEDDDPFAELDNQYHVAVDRNFIENDEIVSIVTPSPIKSPPRNSPTKPIRNTTKMNSPQISNTIKSEIDNSVVRKTQSPLEKLFSVSYVKKDPDYHKTKEHDKNNSAEKRLEGPPDKASAADKSKLNNVDSTNAKTTDSNSRKRSVDQKPSHRKEKRKKTSNSESHDQSTIINLFSPDTDAKESNKIIKKDSDKTYSEKYVKRKDTSKKHKECESSKQEHKKQSTTSHSSENPTESSKTDSKVKLKPINMFIEQPKKSSAHQAHRNTATPLKSPEENKVKVIPVIPVQNSFARKLVKRHVGTQVVKKYRDKEIQTDKQKHATKEVQTDFPVILPDKQRIQSGDPFERMKEIDLEIQVLLQEKFKLYNSLENKNTGKSTMDALGMTVLNMPMDDNNINDSEEQAHEDDIVNDFANIPVEELEQIALETVSDNKRRPKRNVSVPRKLSESPTTVKRSHRKVKTPNISLLEQIIEDDRPIEDIISLDDFEISPVKSKKKSQKTAPKKKTKRNTTKGSPSITNMKMYHDIKECYVILKRLDDNKYLNKNSHIKDVKVDISPMKVLPVSKEEEGTAEMVKEDTIELEEPIFKENPRDILENTSQIVEDVVNLQFDMLDVSEDIVIGDNCEVKEKENERVQFSEEIILDNSQSSIDDIVPESGCSNECKTYDYSTDENLRRDSMTVSGNADAVLAIECIENDFIAACLDGNVYHFSGDGQLINTLRGSNLAVTCVTIVKEKYGTTVYTGSLDSRIRYYDLETGLEKGPECNVLSPIQTMDRAWDTVFVGTRTGFVLQFECKNNMLIPVSTVKFSEQSILALRAMKEGPRKVLLVAARSEDVTIKDAQTGLLLRTLCGPKMTVYTLLFEDGKVYCGTSSHQIHVFDYTSGSHVGCHEGGKGCVCLRALGGLVFAGCYDGCVYVYREGETRPLAQLRGPSLMLLSLAVRGTKIIAGYKDRSLYIWKIPLPVLQEMIL